VVVVILLLVLCLSFSLHLFFLIRYIRYRKKMYLYQYLNTTVINILISGLCIFIALYMPDQIRHIDMSMFLWIVSGFVMIIMLVFQIAIFVRVYRRAHMPGHYHYNFFGKKVLHPNVITPSEVALFFAAMPFLLGAGAYFVARFIRFFI
jgi:hypothetical protein